jgi:hypothetical protein
VYCEFLNNVLLGFLCDHGVSPFKINIYGKNSVNGW